jgi:hypothetical protein
MAPWSCQTIPAWRRVTALRGPPVVAWWSATSAACSPRPSSTLSSSMPASPAPRPPFVERSSTTWALPTCLQPSPHRCETGQRPPPLSPLGTWPARRRPSPHPQSRGPGRSTPERCPARRACGHLAPIRVKSRAQPDPPPATSVRSHGATPLKEAGGSRGGSFGGSAKVLAATGRPPEHNPVATTPATRRGRSRPERLPGKSIVAIKRATPAETPPVVPKLSPRRRPRSRPPAQRPQPRCVRPSPAPKLATRPRTGTAATLPRPSPAPKVATAGATTAATMRQALAGAQARDQTQNR